MTVKEMLDSLRRLTNEETLKLVQFKKEEAINRIVSSWPGAIDNSNALRLGFQVDNNFDDFILQYRREDLK